MVYLNGVAWRGLWGMPALFSVWHITRRVVKEMGGPADIRRQADGRRNGLVFIVK